MTHEPLCNPDTDGRFALDFFGESLLCDARCGRCLLTIGTLDCGSKLIVFSQLTCSRVRRMPPALQSLLQRSHK
jgi:hypothetical protein